MAKRLDTEIIINLAGNLTAKARQYGANMSEFARRNERAMSVVKATSAAAGRGLDMLGNRYTGLIAGFAGGAMLREFSKTDRTLTELGVAAGKTRKEMRQIYSDAQDSAIKFRVDDSEVVKALANANKITGSLDFGVKNQDMMAASISASGSDGESIGGLFATFEKFKTKTDQENLQAMDFLNQLGKEGGFELKDFAEKGTKVFSAYAATGREGAVALKEMGVVFEAAMDAVGDKDLATTAAFNLLTDIRNPKIAKILTASGVKLRDKSGNLLPINDIVKDIAQRSGSDGSKRQDERLSKAGFTDYSRLIISGVSTGKGAENFARYNAVVADGSGIMSDAAYVAQDFTSAMTSLNGTWGKFTDSNLAKPVQELADALNSVDQETVQNWLEIGKNVALATGGLLVARKAFQIGKGAYDFLRPGKKGIPAGVADVFGSGVMPVYVTNMGAGGMGNGGPVPDLPGSNKSKYDKGGVLGMAINTASEITSLVPFPKNDEERAALIQRAQDNSNRKTMWDDIKKWLTAPPAPPSSPQWDALHPNMMGTYPYIPQQLQQLQGEIEVTVKDDRVQVSKVKINTPGVTMSAQTGISNVEQD
ncbi:phage tail protein [Brenneria alni]|uniref:Phage tail protein n=1 Tax=Brenneria alni TaxID=71656 RepID=A0A421DSV5_9GAMM|nr:phage tail protein [Brenneria alni]RLM27511.1 phage tail protein [Brenneria alni]